MFFSFITSAMHFWNILSHEFSAITRNINWIIFTVDNSRYKQGQHTEVTTTALGGFRAFYKTTLLQHCKGELSCVLHSGGHFPLNRNGMPYSIPYSIVLFPSLYYFSTELNLISNI